MEFDRAAIETAIREAQTGLPAGDQLWWWITAESSDFVRLNHGLIRQAGAVDQVEVSVRLVRGRRQAEAQTTVGMQSDHLLASLQAMRTDVTNLIDQMPEDPFLLLDQNPREATSGTDTAPVDAHHALGEICDAADGLDLVGIWASGWLERGLISSCGHSLWHRAANWCFDWSIYAGGDKAVKNTRGGNQWDFATVQSAIEAARPILPVLRQPPKILEPGGYRTWLSPSAMASLIGMFNWGGFSTRAVQTGTSVLQRLADGKQALSPMMQLTNDAAAGGSPVFSDSGHALPEQVPLVRDGKLVATLTAPRSAAEYALPITSDAEYAADLVCAPGALAADDVLAALGTGIHVADCWYTNWSEPNVARATGMTRFHSFWVENGEIVAPLSVMRFDDSLLDGFGDRLEGLGEHCEIAPQTSTYGSRHLGHSAMPGALISEWHYPL